MTSPERIFICIDDLEREWHEMAYPPHIGPWTEYVRADLTPSAEYVAGLQAAALMIRDAFIPFHNDEFRAMQALDAALASKPPKIAQQSY